MHEDQPIPKQINRQAAEWFAVRESGDMTAEDEARLAQWLAVDPLHGRALEQAQAIWHSMDAPLLAPAASHAPATSRTTRRRIWRMRRPAPAHGNHQHWHQRGKWIGGAVAASLAMVAIIGGDVPTWLRADAMTMTGEIRQVTLPDGSTATLNTSSAIAFTADGRTVRLLKGEAAFQVAPNPRHPFSVNAANGTSTALGTRFIVRQIDGGARVTVTEHSVRVAAARHAAVLSEGEMIRYDAGALGQPIRVRVADADAWTRGRMRVVNRPLGEVITELNRYHRGIIRVIGDDVARRPVSGTFDIHDPVGTIAVIRRTLGINSTSLTDRVIFLHS